MRKISTIIFIACLLFLFFFTLIATCQADSVTVLVNDPNAIPASGLWTSAIAPGGIPQWGEIRSGDGFLNISVNGIWVGTVTLQRACVDPNGDDAWCDVTTYTADAEKALRDHQVGITYRIGCKYGEFTSGAVRASLNNAL